MQTLYPDLLFQVFSPEILEVLPNVTHIVGHSPMTAGAALRLRETAYTGSTVILFNHVIPNETESRLTVQDIVRQSEEADLVFSGETLLFPEQDSRESRTLHLCFASMHD